MRTAQSSSCRGRGGWFASVHAGIQPPGPGPEPPKCGPGYLLVWAWAPGVGLDPQVWSWPPRCEPGYPQPDPQYTPGSGPPVRPPNPPPPGCGPGHPQTDPPNIPLGVGLDSTPPVNRILDTCFWKYYLAPNFIAGGNDIDQHKAWHGHTFPYKKAFQPKADHELANRSGGGGGDVTGAMMIWPAVSK